MELRITSKTQNPAAAAAKFEFLNFGIKAVMVASKIQKSMNFGIKEILGEQNSKSGRCRGRFLNFGIIEVIVASKIQNLAAAATEILILVLKKYWE